MRTPASHSRSTCWPPQRSLEGWLGNHLGLLAAVALGALPAPAIVAADSLAESFSYTDNSTNSLWSFWLEEDASSSAVARSMLTSADRDANALWGSDFPLPPLMWSEKTGYWGIGKNTTGKVQVSARNGTRWAPGEVLFHPKAGARLAIGWTAPEDMVADVYFTVGRAAAQGNGIGYQLVKRTGKSDQEIVALRNVGSSITNDMSGITTAKGDQLVFRFDTHGDPGGDISRTEILIHGNPTTTSAAVLSPSSAGRIMAGSDFTFSVPSASRGTFQWRKDGRPISGATNTSYCLSGLKMSDAGAYSVLTSSGPSADARLNVTPKASPLENFPSPVPRQKFPQALAEQEKALATNELMRRFAVSRRTLAADRFRPTYHFVSPESQLNDPNGLCFWQGRWHMFYQAYPPDEFPRPADIAKRRQHWGHAVSDDLVQWRDLPYAIYPGIERMCFSGSTVVEPNQVVAYYPGIGAGQMVAIAKDPLLLNWEKIEGNPVSGPSGDSCIWKEGDTYYGLVGANGLVSSTNLENWTARGEFLQANPFPLGDAAACPGFVPIGKKHLLVSFSHSAGGQYLLGDYNQAAHRFKPYAHGRFNHGTVSPGGVHAPAAAADGQGGVINILNINDGKHSDDWDQIMSLAQQLTLTPDARLRIEPVAAISNLRSGHQALSERTLPANEEVILNGISGNTVELGLEIEPKLARWVQLNVLRSPNAEEQTSITFYNYDRKLSIWYDTKAVLSLDGTRSSTNPDVWLRPPERVTLEGHGRDWASAPTTATPGRAVRLRVFIDRSVVEVFVNERFYLAIRVYPERSDSVGISLRAQGQEAVLKRLDAWQLKSIWPSEPERTAAK